jgi:hypothetical protein
VLTEEQISLFWENGFLVVEVSSSAKHTVSILLS